MRIVFLVNDLEVGGAQRLVLDTANALAKQKSLEVNVITIVKRGVYADRLDPGIRTLHLSKSNYKSPWGLVDIVRRIRRFTVDFGCDVLHSHLYLAGVVGALSQLGMDFKHVVTIHGESYFDYKCRFPIQRAGGIICVSSSIYGQVKAERNRGNIFLLPNFTDVDKMKPLVSLRVNQSPVVGTVGRLAQVKNQAFLLKLFTQARDRVDLGKLVIIGDGPERKNLADLGTKLGLEEQFEITGYLQGEELLGKLREIDIFVLPSLSEGLPLAVLEAMAAGKVVFASSVGELPCIIEDNVNGFLFDVGDFDRAVDKFCEVVQLVQDENRRLCLMKNAIETVESRYSISAHIQELLKIYQQMRSFS